LAWRIKLTETAKKQLAKLDKTAAKRITAFLRERLGQLDNPRHLGKALTGPLGGYWRYRVGDYRIVCEIQDKEFIILVIEVGNRKDVYR